MRELHRIVLENKTGQMPLDEYDLNYIPTTITDIYYWYSAEYYEGSGYAIMRDENGLWHFHDCSHCSCYGPFEHFKMGQGEPLMSLISSFSMELMNEVNPLVEAIGEKY